MKKRTILFVFASLFLISSSNLTAQHFQTVWSGNPYQPMTFVINSATIDGINCVAGDEIAVFDVDINSIEICVGVVVLAGEILPGSPAIITTSTDDPLTSVQDGFIDGHTIIYRIWDSSESEEITMIQATYNTSPPFVSVFSSFGTAIVELEGSSSIRTTAGSLTGCPGNFTVPVDVENMQDVTDFTLTLNYTPAELTYTSYQNVNAGLSGGTLTVTSSSGEVQMTWTSATAITIASGTLLELIFNAPVIYTQTLSDLIWDISGTNCQYLNAGTILPAEFIDGIITIEPYPQAAGTITGSTGVCQGTTGEPYQVDPIVNATSYVWELSPTTAGTINGSGTSITIDWSITYNGQATVSVYGSNNCGNGTSSSLNVQVQALPEAVAESDVQICENATYQLNGVATDYSSILWTTSGDGTFDDATLLNATYTPGANDITNATVTLTLTAYPIAPCTNNATDQMTITFAPLPTSNAGVNDTICENSTCQLSGAATNESGVLWTTSGDGNFSNNTILNPIYTPGTNDITNGSAILTLTAYAIAPCTDDATDNMTLTIISLPVTNAGPDDDVCEDNPAYTLSGTASNQSSILWTTAGDGIFDDATLFNATYTPGANDITNGSVILTLTAYPVTPCAVNATDDMILSIQWLPTANAGADDTICENQTYTLSGSATDYSSILWTTSGDGTFDDATILNATYTLGPQDITNGTVNLTITAYAIGPCTINATDDMTITIQPLPTADAGNDDEICMNIPFYTLSGNALYQSSVLWTTGGDGAFNDATLLNAIYNPGVNDRITDSVILILTAYATLPCADSAYDEMVLYFAPLPVVDAGVNDFLARGGYYYLDASISDGFPPYTYSWIPTNSLDDPTLEDPIANPDSTTSYLLTVTDSKGCSSSDSIIITVYEYFQNIWTGNPYQSMNIIISNAMIDSIEMGPGDEIGLFDIDGYGSEFCVGFTFLTDTMGSRANINIIASADDPTTQDLDGFITGDSILYRLWDSETNTIYDYVEIYYDTNFNNTYTPLGTANCSLFGFTILDQIVSISSGWNIMSFYMKPFNMSMINILDSIINAGDLIKVIDETGGIIQFIPGYGWLNTIGDMAVTEGYYIKVSTNTQVSTNGIIVLFPIRIPLATGWNIMGYPLTENRNAMDALQYLINSGSLIKVIDESGGFIQYIPGYGWMNTIAQFSPGEGYYIKVSNSDTLVYTESSQKSQPFIINNPEPSHFIPVQQGNPYQMMNIIVTKINLGNVDMEEGDELAVFDNNICVGSIVFTSDNEFIPIITRADDPTTDEIDGYLSGNHLNFKFWDASENKEYENPQITFISGEETFTPLETWIGKLEFNTLSINNHGEVQETFLGQNSPNPFTNTSYIDYRLTYSGKVKLFLYDIYGKKIRVLVEENKDAGIYTYVFDKKDLRPGVYFYTLELLNVDKKTTLIKKMVIMY